MLARTGKKPARRAAAWVSVKPCASTMYGTMKLTEFRHKISGGAAASQAYAGAATAGRLVGVSAASVLSLMPYAEPSSPCITKRAGMRPICTPRVLVPADRYPAGISEALAVRLGARLALALAPAARAFPSRAVPSARYGRATTRYLRMRARRPACARARTRAPAAEPQSRAVPAAARAAVPAAAVRLLETRQDSH